MMNYTCKTCGKVFRPEKNEICPRCGDAVSAAVLSQLERIRTEARFLAEEREGHDTRCHEDDAWSGSYGDKMYHSTPNRNTGGPYEIHSAYAAHAAEKYPTRLSNANRAAGSKPARLTNANPNRAGNNRNQPVKVPSIIKIFSVLFGIFWLMIFLMILFGFLSS